MIFVGADLHTPLNGRYDSKGFPEITHKNVDSFRQPKDVAASNALLREGLHINEVEKDLISTQA